MEFLERAGNPLRGAMERGTAHETSILGHTR